MAEAGAWVDESALRDQAELILEAAAGFLAVHENQPFPVEPTEISLLFTDDGPMEELNARWRNMSKPTNVLSFPAFPLLPGDMPGPVLGDIVLARTTIEREAADLGKPTDHHLAHLLVHGFLHLLGYDHIEHDEAHEMESLESSILAELGLSDPYGEFQPE
nr:rRNA maturation RNase YbeY [Pseudohoeflea sp. DP4N28-3]